MDRTRSRLTIGRRFGRPFLRTLRCSLNEKRKLLVIDLSTIFYHYSTPHANAAIGLMGKETGAYEAVFSNDLDNLKPPDNSI